MQGKDNLIYPYIPNSLPEFKLAMMKQIGINDVDELYRDIPEELRFKENEPAGAAAFGIRSETTWRKYYLRTRHARKMSAFGGWLLATLCTGYL